MRTIHSDALAALDSGRFAVRALVKVTIPDEDPFCIWDDVGSLEVDGDIYVGKAGRFTLQPSVSGQDLSIRNLDITLSGLDDEAIAVIDGLQWHQQPIQIQRAIIATESPTLLHLVPEFSGFLDQMFWRESAKGQSTLTFRCESASRELSRSGARTRSDADQRSRDSNDGFYRWATSAITQTVDWGRSPGAQKRGGIVGWLDRVF